MMILPWLMRLSIRSGKGMGFALWFPFFLIWPIFLLIALLLLPIWLLCAFFWVWDKHGRYLLSVPWLVYGVLCSVRGLIVQVQEENRNIEIFFK